MKYKTCTAEQGTTEWLSDRLGYISGSNVHKLMTNPKSKADKEAGNLSGGAKTYALELATDQYYGFAEEIFKSYAMERGNELEPIARKAFEDHSAGLGEFLSVEEVGFLQVDGLNLGYSPDGLVSDGGLLEIKCRLRGGWIDRILNGVPKKDNYQMQLGMMITDATHCWYVCYTDEIEDGLIIEKIKADWELQKEMLEKIKKADNLISDLYQNIITKTNEVTK